MVLDDEKMMLRSRGRRHFCRIHLRVDCKISNFSRHDKDKKAAGLHMNTIIPGAGVVCGSVNYAVIGKIVCWE